MAMKTYRHTEQERVSPRRRAWTLALFVLMVWGIAVFCLIAFMVVYPGTRDRNDANTEVSNLSFIQTNLAEKFAQREGGYGGLNQSMANQARVFPVTMNDGDYSPNAKVFSSWGEPVRVRGIEDGSAIGAYVIDYHAVHAGTCLGIVSGASYRFDQIRVNGIPVYLNETGEEAATSEGGTFNPGKAAEACSDADPTSLVEFVGR